MGDTGELTLGITLAGLESHPGGVGILLVASCYRSRNKLQQYDTLGPTYIFLFTRLRAVSLLLENP